MTDDPREPASAPQPLPDTPDLDWLRKQAKRRLAELRTHAPSAKLAKAQFEVAQRFGFSSWRALKAHVESRTIDRQLLDAARTDDVDTLARVLDDHPEKLTIAPHGWTLLHAAAQKGRAAAVDLLLERGLNPNAREEGDNTCAMHWAAAAGSLDVVRRLADAGGDVVGAGDDHMGDVIGWASCWDGCDDDAHRAVVDFLVSRGARHHIFSAVAMNLEDEVRRIVAAGPGALNQRQSRNENNRTPLQFAVKMNRPAMVALLLELGADPLAVDAGGQPAATYATTPDADRAVMQTIREITAAELLSAARGRRAPNLGLMDVVAVLSLREWDMAERLVRESPGLLAAAGPAHGALHLMAKRGDTAAVKWLLDRGADPNALWAHWDSRVTPLHLAVLGAHPEVARMLMAAGADAEIPDSKHDSGALGWAEFFGRRDMAEMLRRGSERA